MISFIAKTSDKIEKLLLKEGISYSKIKMLLRKKDIKINNQKINKNIDVLTGDEISVYGLKSLYNIQIIFEDENIIIVDKPKKLEVISEDKEINLLNLIDKNYFAVHRLDFNTEGLVVFAKTKEAKEELDKAFKNSLVNKTYITIVKNKPTKKELLFVDYLEKKDGKVKVCKTPTKQSKQIKTQINLLEYKNGFSLIKVNLLTGRTHQIRAHLGFYNLPVLGDEKYGDFKINKQHNLNTQVLKCITLKFNFEKTSYLYYLNNKEFKIEYSRVLEYFEKL